MSETVNAVTLETPHLSCKDPKPARGRVLCSKLASSFVSAEPTAGGTDKNVDAGELALSQWGSGDWCFPLYTSGNTFFLPGRHWGGKLNYLYCMQHTVQWDQAYNPNIACVGLLYCARNINQTMIGLSFDLWKVTHAQPAQQHNKCRMPLV